MNTIGRWRTPLYKPKYPRFEVEMSKEDDITFSFGRETSMEEVMSVLASGTPERPVQAVQCTVCLLRDSARAVQQFSSAKKCPFDKRSALLDL